MKIKFYVILLAISFYACKKDHAPTLSNNTNAPQNPAYGQKTYETLTLEDIMAEEQKLKIDILKYDESGSEGFKKGSIMLFKTNLGNYGKMQIIDVHPIEGNEYLMMMTIVNFVVYKPNGEVVLEENAKSLFEPLAYDLDSGINTFKDTGDLFIYGRNGFQLLPVNDSLFYIYKE